MSSNSLYDVEPVDEREPEELQKDDAVISKSKIIWRRFLRNKAAVVGMSIFLLLCAFAIFGGLLAQWGPTEIDPMAIGQPPSASHWLGTTQGGRDVYAGLVRAVGTSIVIGLIVGIGATAIAAVYGCTMAFVRGKTEKVMLFILETLIMVPAILLVAIVTSGVGILKDNIPGWILLTIVLVFLGWMGAARLIRALGHSLMTREFVSAAKFMGVPNFTIIRRHLIPNIGSLLVLELTRGITAAILSEIAFSFIGVGVKDPDMSLGLMIGQATSQVSSFPWMFWVPLITMFFLTGSLSLLNDGLRDAFDPTSMSAGKADKGNKKKREAKK